MKQLKALLYLVASLTLIVAAGAVYLGARNAPPALPEPPPKPESSARAACREFITQSLNDPDSAEWPYSDEWKITASGDRTWRAEVTMRAKNGFGALTLTTFVCETRQLPEAEGSGWVLVSLSEG